MYCFSSSFRVGTFTPFRRVGEVTAIVEGSREYPVPVLAMGERTGLDAKTPIEPGSEDITAVVTVTFALQ